MNSIKKLNRLTIISVGFILASQSLFAAEPPASLVTIKQVKNEEVSPTVWLSGNVVNRKSARISAEQNGRLTWILDIGSKVSAGDPIAKLDARQLELQKAERSAQQRRQKANIVYLEKQQDRLKALLHNNSTARIEFDRVARDLNVAKEELAALHIQIKQIQLSIEKATIRAPFDGQINRRLSQQGEYISAGVPLVQLVDPVSLDISVAAPLSLAPYLTHNSEVLVKWEDNLSSIPVRTWSPAGDQGSRTFNVRLDASQLELLGGSAVTVSLPSDKMSSATMVPRDALVLRDKQTFVVTVNGEKIAERIEVKVGRGLGDWISVNGKIAAGDQVIIRGGERLQSGQKVRIVDSPLTESSAIAAN